MPSWVKFLDHQGRKNKNLGAGLEVWLKQYSTCLISAKPSSNPSTTLKNRKKNKVLGPSVSNHSFQ
jgi:hypothetical protein